MKLNFFVIYLLMFTCYFSLPGEASFTSQAQYIDDEISLEQVLANTCCVKEISGNKIYLKENHLYISKDSVFLILNEQGDMAIIPELFTDGSGCFMYISLQRHPSNITISKSCPHCGQEYLVYCSNPNCPYKLNKDKNKH